MALGSQGGISTPNASEASQFVVKDFNFAVDKKTDSQLATDGVTFTRASVARYNDSSGNLVERATGEPVYEYSGATSLGLRIEKSSTNRVVNTAMDDDEIATSGKLWTTALSPASGGTTIGLETNITSPDNASNGVSLSGAASGSSAYQLIYDTTTLSSGASYGGWSGSVYAKAGNVNYLGITFCNTVKIGAAWDLSDGSLVNSNNCTASSEDVGGGWWRLKCENLQNVAGYMVVGFTPSKTSALVWNDSALGSWNQRVDYFSVSGSFPFYTYSRNHVFLYGPQFEDSTTCTSYIPNASEATGGVARAADVCSITGSDFSSFYNQTQGAFAVEGSRAIAGSSALPTMLEVNLDGGTTDTMGFNASATKEQFDVYDGSGAASVLAGNDIAANTAFKVSGAYKSGNYGTSLNGAAAVTNTLAAVPTVDQLHFGSSEHSSRELNGFISRVRYWRRRVSDAFLKKIST
jgi:hypothetical protein